MWEFESPDMKSCRVVRKSFPGAYAGCLLNSLGPGESLQNSLFPPLWTRMYISKIGFPSVSLEKTNRNQDPGRKCYHHEPCRLPRVSPAAGRPKPRSCGVRRTVGRGSRIIAPWQSPKQRRTGVPVYGGSVAGGRGVVKPGWQPSGSTEGTGGPILGSHADGPLPGDKPTLYLSYPCAGINRFTSF